jgi:hypothetical protein
VVVDRLHEEDKPTLLGYSWTPERYVPMELDANGRLWLEAVGVYLGVTENTIACWDKAGEKIPDAVDMKRQLEMQNARIRELEERLRRLGEGE